MFPDPHLNLNVLERLTDGLKGDTVQLDGVDEDRLKVLNEALKRLKVIGEVSYILVFLKHHMYI